ncbi:hypothetical protein ACOS9K_18600 [Klebsiella pneumoniae]
MRHNTITAPPCRRMMVMGDSQRFSARNSFFVGAEYRF